MTKTEAYKMLGIGRSTSRTKAEQAYHAKCKELRSQMVPGLPAQTRTKAGAELAKLTTAWQIIKAAPTAKKPAKKSMPRQAPKSKPAAAKQHQAPQTLAEAWEEVVSQMPFPEPVMVIIVIAVLLLTLISLATAL
jgi:hypothetical protein